MISKEEFISAWKSYVGMNKLVKMITDDFKEHKNVEYAKKQHWWLRQRFPTDCGDLFLKNLMSLNYYEEAFVELNRIYGKVRLSQDLLIKYLIKLKHELKKNVLMAEHVYSLHLFWLNPLTKFGKDNLDKLFEVLNQMIIEQHPHGFLEQFYVIDDKGEISSHHKREYYFKFYSESLASKKELMNLKKKPANRKASKDDVFYSIGSACAMLLREAENNLRLSIGGKRIGEGFISETNLYYRVKNHFPSLNVIQHGRPDFLGRQHFDIWIPDFKIAIEYQGEQHDNPVMFFGGEEGFKNNQKRDELKKEKCVKNEVILLEVRPNYSFEVLVMEIENAIKNRELNR